MPSDAELGRMSPVNGGTALVAGALVNLALALPPNIARPGRDHLDVLISEDALSEAPESVIVVAATAVLVPAYEATPSPRRGPPCQGCC